MSCAQGDPFTLIYATPAPRFATIHDTIALWLYEPYILRRIPRTDMVSLLPLLLPSSLLCSTLLCATPLCATQTSTYIAHDLGNPFAPPSASALARACT